MGRRKGKEPMATKEDISPAGRSYKSGGQKEVTTANCYCHYNCHHF